MMKRHAEGINARLRSPLIAGFLGNALTKLSGIALTLGTSILLARLLGPSDYGVYAYAIALVALVAMPVQSGLAILVTRETAYAEREQQWAILKGLWRWSMLVVGGLTLSIVTATLISLPFAFQYIHISLIAVFLWGLALVPLMAWATLRGAALTGLGNVVLGQLPDNILRPGILLVLLLCSLWLSEFQLSAADAMMLTAFAGLLGLITISIVLHLNRPIELSQTQPLYLHRAWFAAIWPLTLVAGIQVVNSHADILILGFFLPNEEIGIYRIATQIATLVIFVLQVINTIVAPTFTRLKAAGDFAILQRVVTRSAQITLLGALPPALALIFFGDLVLETLFGSPYTPGHRPLAILAIGQLINAGMGSVGLLLNMTGHERETIKGVTLATLANIPLNLICIPVWGMSGAAVATMISLLIWNIILWRAAQRCLGLNTTAFRFRNRVMLT